MSAIICNRGGQHARGSAACSLGGYHPIKGPATHGPPPSTPAGVSPPQGTASIEDLIEASSLGTPEAKAARESVDPALAAKIVRRSQAHDRCRLPHDHGEAAHFLACAVREEISEHGEALPALVARLAQEVVAWRTELHDALARVREIDVDAPMATGDAFFDAYDDPDLAGPR